MPNESAQSFVDFEPSGFLELDGDDRIVDANLRVQHWIGRSLEVLIGEPIQWILQEPVPDHHTAEDERVPDLFELHARDGSVRPVQTAWGPHDPDGHRFITLIDAERQLQHARRISEKYAMAERTQKRLELVIQASVAFTEASNEAELAEILTQTATQAYAAEAAAVFVLDADRAFVQLAGSNSLPQLCSSPALLEQAAALHSVLLISGSEAAHQTAPTIGQAFDKEGVRSMLVAPLQLPGEHVGVLAIFFHHPRNFDDQAAPLADALAGQAARAISALRLQEQLAHAALHDDTTGLPNRRIFEHKLDMLAMTDAPRIAVLFVDLDGFKPVNDQLGHHVGDQILRAVGERVRASVRRDDIVARYGGDEFVVVTAVDDEAFARQLAERIRSAIAAPYSMLPGTMSIGASIGIATASAAVAATSLDQLVRAADQAMYVAKSSGGGRVAAQPEPNARR